MAMPSIYPSADMQHRRLPEPPPFQGVLGRDKNVLDTGMEVPEVPSSIVPQGGVIPPVVPPQDTQDDDDDYSYISGVKKELGNMLGRVPNYSVPLPPQEPEEANFSDFGNPITFGQGQNAWQSGDPVFFQGFNGKPSQMGAGPKQGWDYGYQRKPDASRGTPTVPNATARYYQRAHRRAGWKFGEVNSENPDQRRVARFIARDPEL